MALDYLATVAVAITPHDSNAQPRFSGIYVGVGGNIKVKDKAGNTTVLKGAAAGSIIPLADVELIFSTDTTATDLVGLR